MSIFDKVKGFLNKEAEPSKAVLSAITNENLISDKVTEHTGMFKDIDNLERYIVTSARGLTGNQKVENITSEVITKYFGDRLDDRNPVILKVLSEFISEYMDYNGKMNEEGKIPFEILIDRNKYGLTIVGENSYMEVHTKGDEILAWYQDHAFSDANMPEVLAKAGGEQSKESILQIIDDRKAGTTFVCKTDFKDSNQDNIDGKSGVYSFRTSAEETYYTDEGKSATVKTSAEMFSFGYQRETMEGTPTKEAEEAFKETYYEAFGQIYSNYYGDDPRPLPEVPDELKKDPGEDPEVTPDE